MLCQAPGQSGFRLCYCVQQTACPALDLYERCFHLPRMLCISGCSTWRAHPGSLCKASLPEKRRNNKNRSQTHRSKFAQNLCFMGSETERTRWNLHFCWDIDLFLFRLPPKAWKMWTKRSHSPCLKQHGWNSGHHWRRWQDSHWLWWGQHFTPRFLILLYFIDLSLEYERNANIFLQHKSLYSMNSAGSKALHMYRRKTVEDERESS